MSAVLIVGTAMGAAAAIGKWYLSKPRPPAPRIDVVEQPASVPPAEEFTVTAVRYCAGCDDMHRAGLFAWTVDGQYWCQHCRGERPVSTPNR